MRRRSASAHRHRRRLGMSARSLEARAHRHRLRLQRAERRRSDGRDTVKGKHKMKYQPPYGSPGADDPYINGDPSIGQQGSIPPAASIEYPQREIVNLIKASSLVPDDADLKQLTRGVRSQGVNFCIDTGAANALQTMLDPSLTAYRQGLPLRVLVAHNN